MDHGFKVMFVEFRARATGTVHRVRTKGASSLFPDAGASVAVLYDPQHPEGAVVREDHETGQLVLTVLACAFGGVGALAFVAGAILFLVT